jgi:hypothetical protein
MCCVAAVLSSVGFAQAPLSIKHGEWASHRTGKETFIRDGKRRFRTDW